MGDEPLKERARFAMATTNGNAIAVQTPKPPVRTGSHGVQLNTLEEMWRFSEAVARSGIAPRGLQKPEQILIAIEYGAELGLKPMQAMAVVMVVNGRATLYGDGMLAVVQASGLLVDIKESLAGDGDNLAATCTVKRSGPPDAVELHVHVERRQASGADRQRHVPEVSGADAQGPRSRLRVARCFPRCSLRSHFDG
jgi:hypothetical protein